MENKPTIEELLAAVKEGSSKKRRKIENNTNVNRYIEEMGLTSGPTPVPNFVLYWHYRQWDGSDRKYKANKIVFFRTFSQKFKSHRVGKQRFYLVSGIELNDQILEEAKAYDKQYVRLGKKEKKTEERGTEVSSDSSGNEAT